MADYPDTPQYDETPNIDQADIDAVMNAVFGGGAPQATPEPTGSPFSGFAPQSAPSGPGPDAASGIGDPTRDFTSYVAANTGRPAPSQSEPAGVGFSGSFAPYATSDLRDDAGGRKMEAAIGMLRDIFGVSPEGAKAGTAGGSYRDDWERRNPGQNFDNTVVDYGRSGLDTSGMERGGLPVERVYSLTGNEMGRRDINNFNDFTGRTQPFTRPNGAEATFGGYSSAQRAGAGLNPTTLDNGQKVMYDRFNNVTYGMKDGRPDQLLPGGQGYTGNNGARGQDYGFVPTTMTDGRPVFFNAESNQTYERNGDRLGKLLSGGLGSTADRPQRPAGGSSLGWMNPEKGEVKTLLETSDGMRVVVHPNGGAYLYNPDGTVNQALKSQDAVDKAVKYFQNRDAGRLRYDAEIARQAYDYQRGTANVPPPPPVHPPANWAEAAQAGGSSAVPPLSASASGGPILSASANGGPLPPSSPSFAEGAGRVARDEAGRIIDAGGNAAIAANDQINRGREFNGMVWDAATQSWKTQAEMALEQARRAGGAAVGAAGDFARGFTSR